MKDTSGTACRIKITLGNETREELIDRTAFTIGRGRDADVQITSPNISRVHLTVEIRNGSIWIADFGSANGSFINNKEIARHQATLYQPGDKIKLGEAKELLTLEIREPLRLVVPPGEINLDDTQPEYDLQLPPTPAEIPLPPPIQRVAEIDHSAAERILNQARALAYQLREAAEIDAKKIADTAQLQARETIEKADTDVQKSLASANVEAQKIISSAHLRAEEIDAQARLQSTYKLKEAEEDTKIKVEEMLDNAKIAGEKILAEFKPRGEKLVTEARQQATAIKTAAQEEADKLLQETYQKCTSSQISSEEKAHKTAEEAHQKAEFILQESQDEVDQILKDVKESIRKMRQTNENDLSEIKLQSEKKAQQRLDQAKLEADKIVSQTSSQADAQKQSILSKATEEAKEIVNEAIRKSKLAGQEVTRTFHEEHFKLGQTRETLERDVARIGQKHTEVEKQFSLRNEKLNGLNIKIEAAEKLLGETELASKQRVSDLQFRISSLEETLATKAKAVDALDLSAKEALERRQQEEENTLRIKSECELILKKVNDLETQERQLVERSSSLDKQINQERIRLKENLEAQMVNERKEITSEIKRLREQSVADHAKQKIAQDEELAVLKRRELELIKSLRAEADAKARLVRKHKAIETAKALEIYLTPKLQEALKTQVLPESFQNFFQDITAVLTNMVAEENSKEASSSEIMHPAASISDFTNTKKRKRIFIHAAGIFVLLLVTLFYLQEKYGDHRSAAEVFAEELREKEAKRPKFVPEITSDYKTSYTDNIIYTDTYAQFKSDSQAQAKWIRDLNKFFINKLNLNENSVVKFIPVENELVTQLQEKRNIIHFETQDDDIKAMRDIEQTSVEKLTEVLGGHANYKAFREFEKNYFQQNRMPASK